LGKTFKDEFNSKLLHSKRGIVSVANNGPHTNGSQFFILYKSAKHLNLKHAVFGRVVSGLTTLSMKNKVHVDDDDRPLEEIKIIRVTIFFNPYNEPNEEEEKKREEKTQTSNTWITKVQRNKLVLFNNILRKFPNNLKLGYKTTLPP
jgi:peptidyl-prolyl cis-trans isomerase-like protein 2